MSEPLIVTAAIIEKDGKYLITQRPADKHLGGMWEFPGGKLDEGESLEECVEREVREELGIEIRAIGIFEVSSYTYENGIEIELHCYNCEILSEKRIEKLGILDYAWVSPEGMSAYEMLEADLVVVAKLLMRKVREFVEAESLKPDAHYKGSFDNHFEVVVRYALELAEMGNADKEVVELAAWLHDVGSIMGQYENHHVVSAEVADELLSGLGYSRDKIEQVKHCILTHRGSLSMERNTKEARILADADGMSHFDSIDGILTGVFGGNKKKTLEKLERSYVKLSDEAKLLILEKLEKARRDLG